MPRRTWPRSHRSPTSGCGPAPQRQAVTGSVGFPQLPDGERSLIPRTPSGPLKPDNVQGQRFLRDYTERLADHVSESPQGPFAELGSQSDSWTPDDLVLSSSLLKPLLGLCSPVVLLVAGRWLQVAGMWSQVNGEGWCLGPEGAHGTPRPVGIGPKLCEPFVTHVVFPWTSSATISRTTV